MRTALLAAAVCAFLSSAAQAGIVDYTLTDPSYNQVAQSAGAALSFRFSVSSEAVARGTFSLTGLGGLSGFVLPTYTGDVADFVSFTANETATPERLTGRLSIQVQFTSDGSISASRFAFNGVSEQSLLTGDSSGFGGTFGSDNYQFRCGADLCGVSGRLETTGYAPGTQAVPEPATLGLLSVALFGLASARRRVFRHRL